jgi:predicted amidophosphoribosyltransferase
VRSFVASWKEHGLRRAARFAAELVVAAVAQPAADVITYIPPDPERLLRRGHHPAERLARELSRSWLTDVSPLLVRRAGVGRVRQTDLRRDERTRNVRGAFLAVARPPSRVLLVDDVYTTGATVSAAATALRQAGARRVDVVTFARTVRL